MNTIKLFQEIAISEFNYCVPEIVDLIYFSKDWQQYLLLNIKLILEMKYIIFIFKTK